MQKAWTDVKHQIIKTRDLIILAGILLLAMVVGSLWHYPISQLLYNSQSKFGTFFAAFGELPVVYCLITAGVMFLMGRNRERKFIGVIHIIFGVGFTVYGAITMSIMLREYLSFQPSINMAIGVALSVAIIIITVKFFRDADRGTMRKVAFIFILSIAAQTFIIDIVKTFWERPRMSMIVETPGAYFTPWWTIGSEQMDKLVAAGVGKEWFASFPSGHTANAASAMMLTLLPLLKPDWRDKQSLIFFVGAAWGMTVAFSRILLGLHFVTDTVVGFAVMLLVLLFFVQLIFKNEFTNLENEGQRQEAHHMNPQISIITLAVNDLEKSLAFYRDGLGITGEIAQGAEHIAITLEGGLSLALFIRKEFDKFAGQAAASEYFSGICVSHTAESKEEVDTILKNAKAAGGTLPSEPQEYEWGYSGYFKDLDGHLWEIVYFN